MSSRTLLILSIASLALFGCKPQVPRGVLSESKIEAVLYDYHLAQSLSELPGDSMAMRKYLYTESVFRKHGITEADFDSSLVWYTRNTTRLHKIYGRLSQRAKAESQMYARAVNTDHFANLSATGDTANIWGGSDFYLLTPSDFSNRMMFTLDADTTFIPHDKLLWKFSTRFLTKEGGRRAVAGLIVHYDNDSVAGATQRITVNGNVELTVQSDSFSIIRKVSGFVYLDEESKKSQRLLFLDKISLIRMHDRVERPEYLEVSIDSLQTDSIATDSLATEQNDSIQKEGRMTPEEFRESQPVERKINVVKERDYTPLNQRRKTTSRRTQ